MKNEASLSVQSRARVWMFETPDINSQVFIQTYSITFLNTQSFKLFKNGC